MIDGLKPYPGYKQSGLPWLTRLPIGWKTLRGKGVFHVLDVRSKSGNEEILTVSASDGVIPRRQKTVTMFMAESYIGHKLCWPGDLVVNSLWAWMQGLGFSKYHGLISSAYSVYRPRSEFSQNWKFFHYLLRSAVYRWELQTRSKGVWLSRLQLSDSAFLDMPILIPPKDDAEAIVKFLDHATRRLNGAIRAKKKAIALLNEQKQVIIHLAVTRGLDPDVPVKPSGIPWLGDIPKHWEVIPLKFLSRRIQNGATPPTAEQRYYSNGTVPWFGPSSIGANTYVGKPARYLAPIAFSQGRARLIKGPAILVIVIGATAGKMALLDGEGATNQQITAFEVRKELVIPLFCIHQLRLSEFWVRATASTATIPILDSGIVTRLPVAFPTPDKQQAVLDHLIDEMNPYDLAISTTERQIALLQEFRTRLIADVVTGKLDVREAARRIPVEVGELEPELESIEAIEEELQESETMGEAYG